MKSTLLALILSTACYAVVAQSFEDLENRRGDNAFEENGLEVFIRRTQVSAKYTDSFGGTTVNLRLRNEGFEQGDIRYHFENPTLGDMIFVVAKLVGGNDVMSGNTDQSFGSGFFGWHQTYSNVVARPNLLISPGISFGDYIFGSKRASSVSPTISARMVDPAGYFFHVGPALSVAYVITPSLWLDAYSHYDIGFKASSPSSDYHKTDGYPRPHFLHVGANVHHARSRFFGGARMVHLFDRGEFKDAATRIDISVGYMFGF